MFTFFKIKYYFALLALLTLSQQLGLELLVKF